MPQPAIYILLAVWFVSEFYIARTRRAVAGSARRDRGTLLTMWICCAAGTLLAVYAARNLHSCALPHRKFFEIVGAVILVAGLLLRWCAVYLLGRFFTINVAIASGHRIVRAGPYRWIRHPSYAGSLLSLLGFGLIIGNTVSILALFIPAFWSIRRRMSIEEAALTEAFGDEYRQYMRATKRLAPLIY